MMLRRKLLLLSEAEAGVVHLPQVLGVQDHFCPADRAVPFYSGKIEPKMKKIIIYGITQMSYNQSNCWC